MTKRYPDPEEYTLRLVDMPISQHGMISESPDGHVNIFINSRLSHDGQLDAAEHEFDHWRNDDLHNDKSIQEVEGAEPKKPLIFRASELLPKPKPKKQYRPVEDWKDDIYLRLPTYD